MKENKSIYRISLFSGILLILTALLHMVNINDTLVAIKTGDIAASHAPNIVIIWIFSGVCMFLLGTWILFLSPDLRRLSRKAWWQAFIISLALGITALCCWLQYPRAVHVLFFLFLGLVLFIPLVLFSAQFKKQTKSKMPENTR
jgi:hypothetical protein